MLVAHDRWFLEAVGTSVLELEGGRAKFFKGTWHAWRKEQAARELALGRAIEKQEAEIERLERFVDRFRAGTRARQAQARVKKLDKIERIERDPRDGKALGFAFKPPERSGRVIFEVEDGTLTDRRPDAARALRAVARARRARVAGRPERHRQDDADPHAHRRARAGRRASCGAATTSRSGYSPSTPRSCGAKGARTVLEAAQRSTGLKPNEARALLGQFLFSGEEAEKPLDGLSGGERRRLSLAILVHSGANVLVLDEPTNHLDLESREALEAALQQFPGSLLLISHDRALLDAVGTRTVAVEDGTLHSYVGGWPEYLRVREERAEAERTAKRAKPAKAAPQPPQPKPSRAVEEPAAAGQEDRGGDRGGRGRAAASSRRSSPTPRPGTTRARPRSRPSATSRPSARCRTLYAEWEAVAG